MERSSDFSRRDFLRMGGIAGASLVAAGGLAACSAQEEGRQETAAETQEPAAAPEESSAPGEEGDVIYLLDRITCKPADGRAFYDHYMANYVPDALQRGMTLVSANVNPPIWLADEDANNTLEFTWSVPGMMGWAQMVGVSRYDPVIAPKLIDFWRAVDDRVEGRTRTLSAPDWDVESLTTLANLGK